MKTFNQFMTEAYSAQDELNEVVGAALRGAARFIPGLQTGYGLVRGTGALLKGDKTGAVLGYGSAIPGPIGYGFAAADLAREFGGRSQPQAAKPEENKATDTTSATPANNTAASKSAVLSKKDGVEGTGVGKDFVAKKWSDAERQRYQSKRGAEQLKKDAASVKRNTLKTSPEARKVAQQGYAGQTKPLELNKPVSGLKPARYILPKISA
jgi:hypothetical protein